MNTSLTAVSSTVDDNGFGYLYMWVPTTRPGATGGLLISQPPANREITAISLLKGIDLLFLLVGG